MVQRGPENDPRRELRQRGRALDEMVASEAFFRALEEIAEDENNLTQLKADPRAYLRGRAIRLPDDVAVDFEEEEPWHLRFSTRREGHELSVQFQRPERQARADPRALARSQALAQQVRNIMDSDAFFDVTEQAATDERVFEEMQADPKAYLQSKGIRVPDEVDVELAGGSYGCFTFCFRFCFLRWCWVSCRQYCRFSDALHGITISHNVRIHLKVLYEPEIDIETMLASMRGAYAGAGFAVEEVSREYFLDDTNMPDRADLLDLFVGHCLYVDEITGQEHEITSHQEKLFEYRNNVERRDVVVYFVRTTIDAFGGCARHPVGKPDAVVTCIAAEWTLGHEVGHVLGLRHASERDRLMYGSSTWIKHRPPHLLESERNTMVNSALTS